MKNTCTANKYVGDICDVGGVKIRGIKDNWVQGEVDGNKFEAKVYSEPSKYGIRRGRVSKMAIRKAGDWVYNYDRGPDVATPTGRKLAEKVLKAFPTKKRGKK